MKLLDPQASFRNEVGEITKGGEGAGISETSKQKKMDNKI